MCIVFYFFGIFATKKLTLTPQFASTQLMADLKKENFSLKLKIYYLETTLSKVSGVEQFDVLNEVNSSIGLGRLQLLVFFLFILLLEKETAASETPFLSPRGDLPAGLVREHPSLF